ncbi:hypothetical protein [Marinobacter shengliensis]|uniref:hypothetical protein n=1 Tax=Marinobacter shengliensis TaxID=1389223 RepID=UPI002573B3D8|nr:hypothetical protein [Marinobacter shengliensis]BEH13934.1 hypothetical protein MAALD49_13020 [Marinobacter shengliensis]
MDDKSKSRELERLSKLHDKFLESLEPTRGLKSIHVASGCIELDTWLLLRWGQEVRTRGDFVYISDAHYKRSGLYIDYDSLLGFDYDGLVDALLGEVPPSSG